MPNGLSILVIVVLVLVLFGGRGKISDIMGDLAKGIKSFRKGISDSEENMKNQRNAIENKEEINAEIKKKNTKVEQKK